jgi:hypothetical protein
MTDITVLIIGPRSDQWAAPLDGIAAHRISAYHVVPCQDLSTKTNHSTAYRSRPRSRRWLTICSDRVFTGSPMLDRITSLDSASGWRGHHANR